MVITHYYAVVKDTTVYVTGNRAISDSGIERLFFYVQSAVHKHVRQFGDKDSPYPDSCGL